MYSITSSSENKGKFQIAENTIAVDYSEPIKYICEKKKIKKRPKRKMLLFWVEIFRYLKHNTQTLKEKHSKKPRFKNSLKSN